MQWDLSAIFSLFFRLHVYSPYGFSDLYNSRIVFPSVLIGTFCPPPLFFSFLFFFFRISKPEIVEVGLSVSVVGRRKAQRNRRQGRDSETGRYTPSWPRLKCIFQLLFVFTGVCINDKKFRRFSTTRRISQTVKINRETDDENLYDRIIRYFLSLQEIDSIDKINRNSRR